MNKRYRHYTLALMVALALAACSRELPPEKPQPQHKIEVALLLGDAVAGSLRAESVVPEDGERAQYENKIFATVLLFFPNTAEKPIVVETGLDQTIAAVTNPADVARIKAVDCKIYAFANYNDAQTAAIKAVPNEAALLALTGDAAVAVRKTSVFDRRFLMTGEAVRPASTAANAFTPVKLERLAVKIRARITIKDANVLAGWRSTALFRCTTGKEADKTFFVRRDNNYTAPAGVVWKDPAVMSIFFTKETTPTTYYKAVSYTNERNDSGAPLTWVTLNMPYGLATDANYDSNNNYTFTLPARLKRNHIYEIAMTINGKASADNSFVYTLLGVQEWRTGATYDLEF